METQYLCHICSATLNTQEEYEKHIAITPAPHKYKVGEEVLLFPKYPIDEKRPFAKRTIVRCFWSSPNFLFDTHEAVYELNDVVQTGKSLCEGSATYEEDLSGLHIVPAEESTLRRIDDVFLFSVGVDTILRYITNDDINPNE